MEHEINEIYIDGISDLLVGPAVSKMIGYIVSQVSEGKEERLVKVRIVVPTTNLINFLKSGRETILAQKNLISSVAEQNAMSIKNYD